jgi:hypothetical protein
MDALKKLQHVKANLQNTIKGKELLLAELQICRARGEAELGIVIKFLELNLEELRRILADLQ